MRGPGSRIASYVSRRCNWPQSTWPVASQGKWLPVQALAESKGHFFSLVKEGDEFETREVMISSVNDQVATIGLQGCRSRVNGEVVDAAHVCVKGKTGLNPVIATDLMYDVPCDQLPDALESLVAYLPRK